MTLARVQGFIQAKNKDCFDKIMKLFSPYVKENHFVDKNGDNLTEDPNINPNNFIIEIPFYLYKDMAYLFNHDFADKITKGSDIVFASTDNCFVGGYIRGGEKSSVLLEKWAETNIKIKKPDFSNITEFKNWQSKVVQGFFEEYT